MSARGHIPHTFDGRSIQAPGMMRHGPVPTVGSTSMHPLEHVPTPELLENKLAVQGSEMDRLLRENQRLAATHGNLRQELLIAQQEMQKVRGHIARVQAESDNHIRGLLDKISKMEAEIKAGESIKKELQQAHLEAQSLFGARQEMTVQIQQVTEDLQRTHAELKKLPEMHSELDGLMQEHQKLRTTFEHEKGANMELVQKMHAMEKNLITMAREAEKLRLEVQNAEKRAQVAPNPYQTTHNTVDSAYPNAGQSNSLTDATYGQGAVYASSGYGQLGSYASGSYGHGIAGNHADPYGRGAQVQTSGMAAEGSNPYIAGSSATPVSNCDAGTMANVTYDHVRAGAGGGSAYDAQRTGMTPVASHDAARVAAAGGYDAPRGSVPSNAVQYDSSRTGVPVGYDGTRGASAIQYDTARAGLPAGYDALRGASSVQYDSARAGVPAGYDASRGAVASGGVSYDPSRSAVAASGYDNARGAAMRPSAGQFDPTRSGLSGSGAYDATRGPHLCRGKSGGYIL